MPYLKKSVYRAPGNPGRGITPLDRLRLIDVEDIAYMPLADDKGVVLEGDIILKPNRYAIDIYMTPGTIEITDPADGDTDQVGFTPSVKFNHPGNKQEVREFKVNNINTKFIVIVNYCSGEASDLIGTLCNPVRMTPSYTGNKDGNTNEFTFTQINKGEGIFIYRGTIPGEEPVAKLEAGVTKVEFISDGQYQLSDGKASITEIEGGVDGAVVTLVGAFGVDAPSVVASDTILTRYGRPFVATGGSQITFRAYSSGEGKVVWVEQSRFEAS